ncbi:MAG: hypothetical protein M0R66_07775 [Candidatus Omnitrophica bacterium]|nr:hypothetical protein [Candidatus Omnitrophota bacterium]
MKKIIAIFLLTTVFLLIGRDFLSAEDRKPLPRLLFFYSENCHSCHKVRHEIMPVIEKEFFDKIIIEYLNNADIDNYKLMLALKDKYNNPRSGVPVIFIGETVLVGYDQIKEKLKNVINDTLEKRKIIELDKLPGIDLVKHFLSFGALAIIIAGLIDGINPCAFTVIVFFISFLAFQGYRKRELVIIGLSFIFAVFLTYVLVGLGIFRFLYALRGFYFITKGVYYLVAIFCFTLGVFALYDVWLFRKTGKTEGMALQLPGVVKKKIQAIIGMHYRKPAQDRTEGAPSRHFSRLIVSALFTGFLVSLLEAVCTGQLYLPTITFVLKEASLRLRAFGYLLLYNLMFIVPLLVILSLALFGATSEDFALFVKKHMITIKISMVILFFGLGALILIGA